MTPLYIRCVLNPSVQGAGLAISAAFPISGMASKTRRASELARRWKLQRDATGLVDPASSEE